MLIILSAFMMGNRKVINKIVGEMTERSENSVAPWNRQINNSLFPLIRENFPEELSEAQFEILGKCAKEYLSYTQASEGLLLVAELFEEIKCQKENKLPGARGRADSLSDVSTCANDEIDSSSPSSPSSPSSSSSPSSPSIHSSPSRTSRTHRSSTSSPSSK